MAEAGRIWRRGALAGAAVGVLIGLGIALGGPDGTRAAAEEGKSLGEVMKRMKYYNKSLGVECDYCHVPNKFEIDTPRRRTAKWMQEHLVDGLQTKQSQPIDCHTCHDGRARFLPSSQ